jgi:hypothetical protein
MDTRWGRPMPTRWYAGISETPEAYYRPVDLALALTEEFH